MENHTVETDTTTPPPPVPVTPPVPAAPIAPGYIPPPAVAPVVGTTGSTFRLALVLSRAVLTLG
jgi:hypothetical protein